MKKCPKCKEEIADDAKKCKHCGAKIGLTKGAILGIVVLVVIAIAVFNGNNSEEPTKVGENNTTTQKEEVKTEYAINETVKLEGKTLTVTRVKRNYSSGNKWDVPKEGQEWVLVDVTITNESDKVVSYNPFDFKIQDSNGNRVDYTSAFTTAPNKLSYGELASGGKVSGELVFAVPKNDTGIKLIFSTSFWNDKEIVIKL